MAQTKTKKAAARSAAAPLGTDQGSAAAHEPALVDVAALRAALAEAERQAERLRGQLATAELDVEVREWWAPQFRATVRAAAIADPKRLAAVLLLSLGGGPKFKSHRELAAAVDQAARCDLSALAEQRLPLFDDGDDVISVLEQLAAGWEVAVPPKPTLADFGGPRQTTSPSPAQPVAAEPNVATTGSADAADPAATLRTLFAGATAAGKAYDDVLLIDLAAARGDQVLVDQIRRAIVDEEGTTTLGDLERSIVDGDTLSQVYPELTAVAAGDLTTAIGTFLNRLSPSEAAVDGPEDDDVDPSSEGVDDLYAIDPRKYADGAVAQEDDEQPAPAPGAADPDAWRLQPADVLGLPPTVLAKLAAAGHGQVTVGTIDSWASNKHQPSVPGVGPGLIRRVDAALERFHVAWTLMAADRGDSLGYEMSVREVPANVRDVLASTGAMTLTGLAHAVAKDHDLLNAVRAAFPDLLEEPPAAQELTPAVAGDVEEELYHDDERDDGDCDSEPDPALPATDMASLPLSAIGVSRAACEAASIVSKFGGGRGKAASAKPVAFNGRNWVAVVLASGRSGWWVEVLPLYPAAEFEVSFLQFPTRYQPGHPGTDAGRGEYYTGVIVKVGGKEYAIGPRSERLRLTDGPAFPDRTDAQPLNSKASDRAPATLPSRPALLPPAVDVATASDTPAVANPFAAARNRDAYDRVPLAAVFDAYGLAGKVDGPAYADVVETLRRFGLRTLGQLEDALDRGNALTDWFGPAAGDVAVAIRAHFIRPPGTLPPGSELTTAALAAAYRPGVFPADSSSDELRQTHGCRIGAVVTIAERPTPYAVIAEARFSDQVVYTLHPVEPGQGVSWGVRWSGLADRPELAERVPLAGIRCTAASGLPYVFGADAGRVELTRPWYEVMDHAAKLDADRDVSAYRRAQAKPPRDKATRRRKGRAA